MKSIDLNCDMGESFGSYNLGFDQEVMPHITSANIACGWHAGDPMVMDRTVAMAARHGVGVGAHPGYPDLMGFGRRHVECHPDEITNYVIYQVGALQAFCQAHGVPLRHVKPHGGLYNRAVADPEVAHAIARAIAAMDPGLLWVVLAGSMGEAAAEAAGELGLKVCREAFPDRAYTPEGALAPRGQEGAVIHDPEVVVARALMMASQGKVIATNGSELTLTVDTLCVHGDNPSAVQLVRHIGQALAEHGVRLSPMGQAA